MNVIYVRVESCLLRSSIIKQHDVYNDDDDDNNVKVEDCSVVCL